MVPGLPITTPDPDNPGRRERHEYGVEAVTARRVITGLLVSAATITLPVSVAGASSNPYSLKSLEARAKASATCNAAILSDKVIAAKTAKACEQTVTTGSTPALVCSHSPNVYELWLAPGDTPLIRVGYKPVVYSASNFYASDETQLCGDPTPAGDTPPPPAMTQAQVKVVFKACERTECPVKFKASQIP